MCYNTPLTTLLFFRMSSISRSLRCNWMRMGENVKRARSLESLSCGAEKISLLNSVSGTKWRNTRESRTK